MNPSTFVELTLRSRHSVMYLAITNVLVMLLILKAMISSQFVELAQSQTWYESI